SGNRMATTYDPAHGEALTRMPARVKLYAMHILKRSAVLLLLAVIALAVRGRIARTSAADSEDITWGAIDPTWSPDSRTLAFSLFGSIWRAPAEGGEAEQITTSPRYHAHPTWSPKGDRI